MPVAVMKKYFLISSIFLFIAGCGVNKGKIDNSLKIYFDSAKVDGCFSMFDNSTGKVTVYNMMLDTQRILPGSTFDIVNSLIGLETGKIEDERMVIKPGSIDTEWNRGLSMDSAFRVSGLPYFQEVSMRIGRDTMKQWIDALKYGNMEIGDSLDSFWLNNTLKISPDEQLGLVKKLYFDQLPFQKRSQQIVRDLMLQENNTLYKFSYKTGEGLDENHNSIGWVVGWVEENRHVYFFTTLVKTAVRNDPSVRMKISKSILQKLGFFKGEM